MDHKFTFSKKYDIKISVHAYVKAKDYTASWLHLDWTGDDINLKLLNSLRRVSMDDIPTYAVPQELIKIPINTSVPFDNGQLSIRFAFMPILGVDPELSFLNEIYWRNVKFNDENRIKHENEKNVNIYINAKNNTGQIIDITTNDMTMYIDEKQITPYSQKYPILIVKLQPNDTLNCHMKAVLATGDLDARWRASKNSVSFAHEEKPNVLCLNIESSGQIDEFEILLRSCEYLIKKLNDIKKEIVKKFNIGQIDKTTDLAKIFLDKEDYTIEIINHEMQQHKNSSYSGFSKPDQLIKSVTIAYCCDKEEDYLKVVTESIDLLIDKYNYIGHLIGKVAP